MGVGGQHHAPAALPGKDPVPIVQEAGWAQGPVWTGAENLALPIGIRSPDRPTRGESLYRLSYRGRRKRIFRKKKYFTENVCLDIILSETFLMPGKI